MKRNLLVIVALLVIVSSCKKNSGSGSTTTNPPPPPPPTADSFGLSRIFESNIRTYEFDYANGNLVERRQYEKNDQNKLLGKVTYTWASGKLKEFRVIDISTGKPISKTVFTVDADNRVVREDLFSYFSTDTTKVINTTTYDYTGTQLTKVNVPASDGNAKAEYLFTWYANGSLKKRDLLTQDFAHKLIESITYDSADAKIPVAAAKTGVTLLNSFADPFIYPKINTRWYDDDGKTVKKETATVYSNRTYKNGLLMSQQAALQNIIPAAFGASTPLKYEYVKIL